MRKRNTCIGGKGRGTEFLRNIGILLNISENDFSSSSESIFLWVLHNFHTLPPNNKILLKNKRITLFLYTALITGLLPLLTRLDKKLNNPELEASLVIIKTSKKTSFLFCFYFKFHQVKYAALTLTRKYGNIKQLMTKGKPKLTGNLRLQV